MSNGGFVALRPKPLTWTPMPDYPGAQVIQPVGPKASSFLFTSPERVVSAPIRREQGTLAGPLPLVYKGGGEYQWSSSNGQNITYQQGGIELQSTFNPGAIPVFFGYTQTVEPSGSAPSFLGWLGDVKRYPKFLGYYVPTAGTPGTTAPGTVGDVYSFPTNVLFQSQTSSTLPWVGSVNSGCYCGTMTAAVGSATATNVYSVGGPLNKFGRNGSSLVPSMMFCDVFAGVNGEVIVLDPAASSSLVNSQTLPDYPTTPSYSMGKLNVGPGGSNASLTLSPGSTYNSYSVGVLLVGERLEPA